MTARSRLSLTSHSKSLVSSRLKHLNSRTAAHSHSKSTLRGNRGTVTRRRVSWQWNTFRIDVECKLSGTVCNWQTRNCRDMKASIHTRKLPSKGNRKNRNTVIRSTRQTLEWTSTQALNSVQRQRVPCARAKSQFRTSQSRDLVNMRNTLRAMS
jgi:hypothetical protein